MGESVCKQGNQQGVNIQNIQIAHTTQYQNKQPNQKNGRTLKQTFFQRRHSYNLQTYEKMFSITNYQGNANQNHNEITPHTHQNDYYQKGKQ